MRGGECAAQRGRWWYEIKKRVNVGSVVVAETFMPELEVKGTCREGVRRLYSHSSSSIDEGSVVGRDSSSKQRHTTTHEVHEG